MSRMNGAVRLISRNNQMAAVETCYGYTVFQIEYGEVSVGDEISGNLDDHGTQNLVNKSSGQTLTVYIEAIQATLSTARSLLAC